MKKIFCAERDSGSKTGAAVLFNIESPKAESKNELLSLAKAAIKAYALTKEGCAEYSANCDSFTWDDLMILNDNQLLKNICKDMDVKIEVIGTADEDCFVDLDEQLMDNISADVTDILWDTGNENKPDLPSSVTINGLNPYKQVRDELTDQYGYPVLYCRVTRLY